MRARFQRLFLVLLLAGVARAAELPYRFLLVIHDQWTDSASEVIEEPGEFSMTVALLKSWGLPFDIYRLDQQRFDAYHLLDRNGRPLHGTIIWNAPGARLDDEAGALLRRLVREEGVGLIAFSDSVRTPVVAELTGATPTGSYESSDRFASAGAHFIARGVNPDRTAASVSKLLRNAWKAADKMPVRGTEVRLAEGVATVVQRGARPWLTARVWPGGGRVVWLDAERTTAQIHRQESRDLFKRSLVWANGFAVYADYGRSVMLSMDDMGAADKTFYPGWHYPTLSEQTIREHIIAPLQQHRAVLVQNIVPGFVDRVSRRVVSPWSRRVVDELDPTIVHDFASTKRGLDAGVRADVFEIQSHGWTHMPPDLDSPPGPFWSAPPRSPLVQLNWYKEFGDYIRKAEITASVQRVHLERGLAALEEDFGVRALSLVCGGGLSSHSLANNTMRLAAKLGFGYAQPESAFYLGSDFCVALEPISPRLQWQYDQHLTAEQVPWTNDAPVFLGLHDRDVAMDARSFAQLLDDLGPGVRFMTFAEYCGYLHAQIGRVAGDAGLAIAVNYDPHYGAFFTRHASRWTLHLSDNLATTLHAQTETRSIEVPAGESRFIVRVR